MKISIITVTFNRAHIIRDAIEGVLRQSYKNYEYIIVDGKSKDNTVELLKEYEEKFHRLSADSNGYKPTYRWISEPDKGLYDAINKGFKMATGDVVGIINSDDYFHRDDTFDIIAKAFEDKTVKAIYADNVDVDIDHPEKGGTLYYGGFFKPWMYRLGMMPSHPTFYAKKELFEKYGYYKLGYKIAADYELMLRFFYVNKQKAVYVPKAIMTFRTGGVSTQWKNKIILNEETIKACRENGLWSNMALVCCKYPFKIVERLLGRIKKIQ